MANIQKLSGAAHLFYFSSLQLIIYADRSLMAALLPQAKLHFEFNEFQSGLLGSGFMGGFMMLSPFVALARGAKAVTRTIGISLLVWFSAMLLASASTRYEALLLARVVAGAGEAGFCSLAPPIIDDTAPPAKRSLFIAVYYSGVFIGLAMGFVASSPFTVWETGRFTFFGLALVMLPYCIFILRYGSKFHVSVVGAERYATVIQSEDRELEGKRSSAGHLNISDVDHCTTTGQSEDKELQRKRSSADVQITPIELEAETFSSADQADSRGLQRSKAEQVRAVLGSGMYVFLVLGFSASQFVIGGFAFWAATYLQEDLKVDKEVVGMALGFMTISTGILGSTCGGSIFDRLTVCAKARWNRDEGVRGVVGCWFCCILSILVVPSCCGTAVLKDGVMFLVCLGGTQIISFMGTAPLMVSMMDSVPSDLRGLAMGTATFGSHLLGDLFSPVLVGQVAHATGSLRYGIACLCIWSVWCPIMWGTAYCFALRKLGPVHAPTIAAKIGHSSDEVNHVD